MREGSLEREGSDRINKKWGLIVDYRKITFAPFSKGLERRRKKYSAVCSAGTRELGTVPD